MKLVLADTTSGYDLSPLNNNFDLIELELQNKVLYRNNPTGEPNQMENALDMNSNPILNASTDPNNPTSLLTVQEGDQRYVNTTGDALTGNLSAGGFIISNLGTPSNGTDAARLVDVGPESSAQLRADLASSVSTEGSDLVAHTGTTDTVTEALDKRTIYVGSVSELEALPSPSAGQEALVGGCPFKYNGAAWKPTAHVTPEIYGATFDGSDDAPAWNAMAAAIDSGQVVKSSTPGGTSTCNGTVTFTKDVIFDMPNVTVNMTGGSFDVTGSYTTATATLSSSVQDGETTLGVTDSAEFSAGDLFIIQDTADFSFSAHRAAYQKGEFVEITNTGVGTITISDPLRDNYAASASLKFFKISPVKVEKSGIKFTGTGALSVVNIDLARNVDISNISISGGQDRALSLRRCYGVRLKGGIYEHRAAATGTNYGISIANCQNAVIEPRLAFGTRHGVTTGGFNSDGAIVNRDIFIRNATVSNSDAIYSADFHGNSENCWYENCVITNRAGIAGKNCGVRGGTIDGADNDLRVMTWHEVVGGDIVFDGCRVIVRGLNTAFGYAASSIMAKVEKNFRNVLKNIVIDYRGSRANPGIFGNMADGTKVTEWSVLMDNVKYIDGAGVINRVASFALENPSAFATAPAKAKRVYIDNIEVPNISNLVLWASDAGGAIASGTRLTLPSLTFAGSLTILAGNSDSPDLSISYPSYLEVPHIDVGSDQISVGANYYAVAVTASSSATSANLRLTTLNAANTVAANRTARVSAVVGLKDYLVP